MLLLRGHSSKDETHNTDLKNVLRDTKKRIMFASSQAH